MWSKRGRTRPTADRRDQPEGSARASALGDFEQLVLMGVLRLADQAYGAAIRQEIHARSGRDVSINAVYTTLDRLEGKGRALASRAAPLSRVA